MPIYSIDMSFNFLLQATRILHVGNYDEDELIMIYNYLKLSKRAYLAN